MASTSGKASVDRYMSDLRASLQPVLKGAARAGGKVIADEVKARAPADEIRQNVTIRSRTEDGRIIVRVGVKAGWSRYLGIWAEYGTEPHYITVDESQREGKSAGRINALAKAGTLVINGKPVGKTVFHPGARKSPFMRVSLDLKEDEAIAAAKAYIKAGLTETITLTDVEGGNA